MAENVEVRNEVGAVYGQVVQAGSIDQVVVHLPQPRRPVPQQLPGRVRDFSGRAEETAALTSALARIGTDPGSTTTLVLHGTAGVGKTTLAVWWAHEARHLFPDGTLFTDLRGFSPGTPSAPTAVLAGFLAALGVQEHDIPGDLDAQSALYRSLLADRRVLVLLDNGVNAEQVRPLLPAAPGCLVLVTSRSALRGLTIGHGATGVEVALLDAAEAFAMVAEIIGGPRADAERAAVRDLVDTCARLPLALRIAASRVATSRFADVADVVEEIRRSPTTLSSPDDERSAVTTVFSWSYTGLPDAQARLFRLLGLHPGAQFGLHAAAALDGTAPHRTAELLGQLADQHLVQRVDRHRYRLHDLLHSYAAVRADSDESGGDEALVRLLTWYAHAADAADELVFPRTVRLKVHLDAVSVPAPVTTRAEALAWLTTEHTTLVAAQRLAVERGLADMVVLLAGAARHLTLGRRALWRDRLHAENEGLAAARRTEDSAAEAFLLVRRGNTHRMLGGYAAAIADFRSVLGLTDDPSRRYEALCGLGSDGRDRGRHLEALTFYAAALPVARQSGDLLAEATVVCNLGQLNAALGRFQAALRFSRRELELRRGGDDAIGVAYAQHDTAVAHQGLGEHTATIKLCEEALRTYAADCGADDDRAAALETLSTSLAHTGRNAEAARYLREAADLLTDLGAPRAQELRRRAGELPG